MRRGFGLYSLLGISLMLVFAWGFHPAAAPDSADLESSQFVRFAAGARHLTAVESDQFFRESATSPYAERGGVIQFDRLPDSLTRVRLAEQGVVLRAYLPDRAFLATIPSTIRKADLSWAGIQWVGALRPEEKLAEALAAGGTPQFSRDSSGASRIKVKLYGHVRPEDAATWLASQYGARIVGLSTLANVVEVALPADNWFDIAHDERVVWVEPYLEPMLLNNSCRANVGADVAQAAPYSLDGSGVWIGEWDGGWADGGHPDFNKRVVQLGGGAVHWHSTHVAGTVIGSGAQSGGTYRGIAPAASIVSRQWWADVTGLQASYQYNIDNYQIDISQNSWGTGASPINVENCNAVLGNYFVECGALDDIVRGDLGRPVSISWSAGNERSQGSSYCGSIGFTYGSLTPYGTAKNLITVGAINSNNSSMTSFSSWGPTDDGRIKPELVAPGCQSDGDFGVTSTWPGSGYNTICGTSMASPVVSGCMALWYQQYRNLHPGQNPLASTVKSVFVETADDLGETGPSYDFGYGRINVVKAIDLLNAGSFLEDQLNDATAFDWTFNYDGSLPQVSFTLAWDDPGAAENANPTLVNDLDLTLISPSGLITLFPWRLDPANPANPATNNVDHINNLEQVRRTTLPETGLWKVRVTGYGVAMGPQKFSLAYTPGIVLSQVEADYAAQLIAGANQSGIPGHRAFTFQIKNLGRRDDTYDLALTGARGWTITPNPITPTVQGLKAGNFTFDDFVPYGTQPGVVDTIIALMTSNANPAITATDTLLVTVSPGFGVVLDARLDTAGVPSRVITKSASVINSSTSPDIINWTLANPLGWPVVPAGGSLSLNDGADTTFSLAVTIPPSATAGQINQIVMTAVSQTDTTKKDRDTIKVQVIAFPPSPVLRTFINGTVSNSTSPLLVWSHAPYSPFPPGYGVFSHSVEIADDTSLTVGVVRYDAIADTQVAVPGLADGTHFWRAITYGGAGDSSGFSTSGSFYLDTQAPGPPYLITPADQAATADSTPVFVWGPGPDKSAPGITIYFFELSLDSLFGTYRSSFDSLTTTATSYQLPIYGPFLPTCHGKVFWRVRTKDPAGNLSVSAGPNTLRLFRSGDLNDDCAADVFDVIALIDVVFSGAQPPLSPDQGEVNCVPGSDVFDVIYLIDHVFSGGPVPCGPE